MEFWTTERELGGAEKANGTIQLSIQE